jgi:hypothetical protein
MNPRRRKRPLPTGVALKKSTYLMIALKSRAADVLHSFLRDTEIKKWTLEGSTPSKA